MRKRTYAVAVPARTVDSTVSAVWKSGETLFALFSLNSLVRNRSHPERAVKFSGKKVNMRAKRKASTPPQTDHGKALPHCSSFASHLSKRAKPRVNSHP